MKLQFIGDGGHASVLRDICEQFGFEIVSESERKVIAYGSIDPEKLEERYLHWIDSICPCMIHNDATVSNHTIIGNGTHVLPRAVINRNAKIGDLCIINTGAIIEHGAKIGNGCHIAPGAIVLGDAEIGDFSFIGSNAVIVQGARVPSRSFIRAGSVYSNNKADAEMVP